MSTYDPTRPAPSLVSAENLGPVSGEPDLITVRLTFTDTADDEYLVSAYFQGENPPATQNIDGAPGVTGERVADVVIGAWVDTVMLRYLWTSNFSDPNQNIWGPWSNQGPVTVASSPAAPSGGGGKGGGKGHGKGGSKA